MEMSPEYLRKTAHHLKGQGLSSAKRRSATATSLAEPASGRRCPEAAGYPPDPRGRVASPRRNALLP